MIRQARLAQRLGGVPAARHRDDVHGPFLHDTARRPVSFHGVPFLQDDQPFRLVAILGVEHPGHPVLTDGIAEHRNRGEQVQQLADDRGLYIDHIAHSGTT
ncbi:hypothetical protein AAHB60_08870 [Pseudomonas aeruginosa]